jgi:glutamate synthase domain-containing protein 2
MRKIFVVAGVFILLACLAATLFISWHFLWVLLPLAILFFMGIADIIQTKHTIKRNFPLFGRMRYVMEELRPKLYQYFIESDIDGRPINRIDRNTIYQRAKQQTDSMPFGTQLDVYAEGYEWMSHSIAPKDFNSLNHHPRVQVGNFGCKQPYNLSILNVSAMSFGSLSAQAIMALNFGAKKGGFAHNTGEGGLSPYHLTHGGDIIWQIGTGYFGARNAQGQFDAAAFRKNALRPEVKMIELKLSQGAKPGHGGILPGKKNTPEIAAIRLVEPGTTVYSPPYHSAFSTPTELVQFLQTLRTESDGKPVGFKLCVGRKHEFIAICKAMQQLNIYPDFITVDGGEGGTGAAPQEFSNYVGAPLMDGLAFVTNILNGMGLKQHIKVIASGKVLSGFHIVRAMALGADACNSARAMMMAIGCIQALVCNTNKCPTGIATQDPQYTNGLNVPDKATRVFNYHEDTLKTFVELIGAAGIDTPNNITRSHIFRRVFMNEVRTFEDIFPSCATNSFNQGNVPERYKQDFEMANANKW